MPLQRAKRWLPVSRPSVRPSRLLSATTERNNRSFFADAKHLAIARSVQSPATPNARPRAAGTTCELIVPATSTWDRSVGCCWRLRFRRRFFQGRSSGIQVVPRATRSVVASALLLQPASVLLLSQPGALTRQAGRDAD